MIGEGDKGGEVERGKGEANQPAATTKTNIGKIFRHIAKNIASGLDKTDKIVVI